MRVAWRFFLVPLAFSLLLTGTNVSAESIPGQDDPAFVAALDLWLSDDDKQALPALSALAKDGNTAARMLIALIDKGAAFQGPWLALRSKRERIGLLRDEGGLSGTSWMRRVGDQPIAGLLLDLLDSKGDYITALSLADFGEARAVRVGLVSLEARQNSRFGDYADDPRFPKEVRYLIWQDWDREGDKRDLIDQALTELAEGDPQRGMLGNPGNPEAIEDWLLETEIAQPLKQLCAQNCAKDQGACLVAGYRSLGGYRQIVSIGTPIATLISEERFAQSPRGQVSVLRQALSYVFMTEARLKRIAEFDTCYAALLEDEGQKF